ncbi:MAG: bifunctional precorrin-2 dehydrogenase/sirohydrochlorin ferrochelatase [Phycisphaeraceae bacterium]|nr:bifunctional precorrin-2 dehydrogenase/sirohydrochlorin ferrochelatase [Phycisphaeraceae bacterium]
MADLPVMLRVHGRRCVVVGGGAVALRRASALLAAGADVTVIAPEVDPRIAQLPLHVEKRAYAPGDLANCLLAVAATDDPAVNERIGRDARAAGALVNRPDAPEQGDVQVPAHRQAGPVTLAVHTGGISAAAAGTIADECLHALDPDWPRLLELAAPLREQIQRKVTDATDRQRRLRALTDAAAMKALKHGGVEAAQAHCRAVAEGKTGAGDGTENAATP